MTTLRKHGPKHSRTEAGLSLLELLIAMALLAVIAISVVPLLTRSLADRNRAWEATEVSNFAQSQLEPLLAAPYDSDILDLEPGTTEREWIRSWSEGDPRLVGDSHEGWTEDPGARHRVFWRRETRVRWYGVEDLATPLDADADPTEVHLKEIRVRIVGERRSAALGASQEIWIRVLKAF